MISFRQTTDLDLVKKLHRKCFPDCSQPYYKGAVLWLIYWNGKLAGFTGVKPYETDPDHVFFFRTAILKSFRGKNIHKAAIRHRLRWCRRKKAIRVFTYTHWQNFPSICALIKCGFQMYESDWAGKSGYHHFQIWF